MRMCHAAAFAVASFATVPAWAFNSDEHKMIGDKGSADVKTCEDDKVRSCRPRRIESRNHTVLVKGWEPGTEAFRVTAGWHDQLRLLLTRWDQRYYSHFNLAGRATGQAHYNASLHEAPAQSGIHDALPLLVWVGSSTDTAHGQWFTLGDLVALYGDYRRAVTCDEAQHECLLSEQRNIGTPLELAQLRLLAGGRTPPMGELGNQLADSGGAPIDSFYWGDEMMRIARTNDWHFGPMALKWYLAMHRQAIMYARLAVDRADDTYLWQALHFEANGLHSLTDLFAPGHMIPDRDETVEKTVRENRHDSRAVRNWFTELLATGEATVPQWRFFPAPNGSEVGSFAWSQSMAALHERDAHDHYNAHGAIARTFNWYTRKHGHANDASEDFPVFGDGKLFLMHGTDWRDQVLWQRATAAVKQSLTTLFDAYGVFVELHRERRSDSEKNAALREILNESSTTYEALRYLPVELHNACSAPGQCFAPAPGAFKKTRYFDLVRQLLTRPAKRINASGLPRLRPEDLSGPEPPSLPRVTGQSRPPHDPGGGKTEYANLMGEEPK